MLFLIKVSTNVWMAIKFQHKCELVSIGRRSLKPWQEGVKATLSSGEKQNLVTMLPGMDSSGEVADAPIPAALTRMGFPLPDMCQGPKEGLGSLNKYF